ncbi:MAG: tetratricopeptide repeat protein [Acidobacteria bacterium]|nr:tetratricopeptide repeat protein [Acidobacteriota bacterium]
MSKFRQSRPDPHPPLEAPMLASEQAANLVPMTAEEFARLKRQKILRWGIPGVVVAIALGVFLYRFTLPVDAQNSYIAAQKLFDSGKYPDALSAVERATRDRTQRVRALQLRAAIYQSLHRTEEALTDIGRVIELQPKEPGNYRDRARLNLDAGHVEKALADYTKLIEIENGSADYNGRGLCYVKLNQPQRAIEDFTRALEHSQSVESHLQRGLAYASIGDHKKAIEDFDAAMELAPSSSAIYRARANSLIQLGDRKAAEKDRDKAMSIEKPQQPIIEQVTVPKR